MAEVVTGDRAIAGDVVLSSRSPGRLFTAWIYIGVPILLTKGVAYVFQSLHYTYANLRGLLANYILVIYIFHTLHTYLDTNVVFKKRNYEKINNLYMQACIVIVYSI